MFNLMKGMFGSNTAVDFKRLVEEGAAIIDVRTPVEYHSGHITKSVNIPLDTINSKLEEIRHMNKTVITVCRSGNRSGMAKTILQKAGIEVYNGGAWNKLRDELQ